MVVELAVGLSITVADLPAILAKMGDHLNNRDIIIFPSAYHSAAKLAAVIVAEYIRGKENEIETKIEMEKLRQGFKWRKQMGEVMRDEFWMEVEQMIEEVSDE